MRHAKTGIITLAIGAVLASAGIAAATVRSTPPKFCSDKKLGRLEQPICDLYSRTSASEAKIAELEKRLKALELTPSPLPTPTPTPTPNPACGGGYPNAWCSVPKDTLIDNWGMYNRESVSYAAYKVSASGRTMPYWGGHGNANQWPANARAAGIAVDGTPRVGDVAIANVGAYGVAMYVEALLPGGKIHISAYDLDGLGNYSEKDLLSNGLTFIHF